MTGLLILAGVGVAYLGLRDRPEIKRLVESIRAKLSDLTTPEPEREPIPEPTAEQETVIAMRGGTWEELVSSGLQSYVSTGGEITGTESVDEILAAGTGAYLAAGPLGAVLAVSLTAVAQQEVLMDEIAAWKTIRFMASPEQEREWAKRKKKSKRCVSPWDCPKLDPTVHARLHRYEVDRTKQYTSEAGRADFQERLKTTLTGEADRLSSWGWTWLSAQGVDIVAVQENLSVPQIEKIPAALTSLQRSMLEGAASMPDPARIAPFIRQRLLALTEKPVASAADTVLMESVRTKILALVV